MKKFRNLVIGGIQTKIFNLILITVLLLAVAFMLVSLNRTRMLSALTTETSLRQQETTSGIIFETMSQVTRLSMERTTAMEARIVDEMFRDIKARAKKNHTNAVVEGMGAVMPEPDYDLPLDGTGDAAIYVLARICGEGNDRQVVPGDFLLTAAEERDILALAQQFPKFMLVLNVGGPVDLSPVADRVGNILVLSQLGVETGAALADVLLGIGLHVGEDLGGVAAVGVAVEGAFGG